MSNVDDESRMQGRQQYISCLEKLIASNDEVPEEFTKVVAKKLEAVTKDLNSDDLDKIAAKYQFPKIKECDLCSTILLILLALLDDLIASSKKEEESLANKPPPDLLSISQRITVRKALQFVVGLGIAPCLQDGVGVPMSKRVKDISTYRHIAAPDTSYSRLSWLVKALLHLLKHSGTGEIVVESYLSDLLASLLQLAYGPPHEDSQWFKRKLKEVVGHLHQPTVIKEVMVLIGNSKAPPWLRKIGGLILTDRLKADEGVLAFIEAMVSTESNSSNVLAGIIASPLRKTLPETYASNVCSQVFRLIPMNEEDPKFQHMTSVSRIVQAMSHSNAILTHKYVFRQIMQPLSRLYDPNSDVSCEESAMDGCISQLSWLMVDFVEPDDVYLEQLNSVIVPLFYLHAFLLQGVSRLKSPVRSILRRYFSHAPSASVIKLVFAIISDEPSQPFLPLRKDVSFGIGSTGGVVVLSNKDAPVIPNDEFIEALNELVALSSEKEVMCPVFLKLMSSLSKNLEDPENLHQVRKRLLSLQLLVIFSNSETMASSISQNNLQEVCQLIQVLLDQEQDSDDKEDVTVMALSIVYMLISHPGQSQWQALGSLLPSLNILSTEHPSSRIQTMADSVLVVLATHGVAKIHVNSKGATGKSEDKKASQSEDSPFKVALREACDPLLPVRGHGLLALAKLIALRDKETMEHEGELLELCTASLREEDSYIYLMAIQGLVALCNRCTDTVIPIICREYCSQREVEARLKIGEALVRTSRMLGDMIPHYAPQFINALLTCVKDPEPLIRASAITNLGELCKRLKFAIHPYLQEVMICSSSLLGAWEPVEVQRAAVLFYCLLLDGVDSALFLQIPSEVRDLHRALQALRSRGVCDAALCCHIQTALQQLDELVKAFLTPSDKLQKEIHVISPPP